MPSKRVSLKGKGADLFFGDYSPTAEAHQVDQDSSPLQPAEQSEALGLGASDAPVAAIEDPTTSETPVPAPTTPAPRRSRQSTRTISDGASLLRSSKQAISTDGDQASHHASKLAISTDSDQASHHASKLASTLVETNKETIATIRRLVRIQGREVSYNRLTPEEKQQLADIVYAYKQKGQKTSENEINRIAINHLLLDYQERGDESVLANVLAALLA